ncbi:glycosyltransferase family 2 protein [Ferrimonas balearica]|nr:glycosyltransferase family 2 protein [Ferrimonas balearica]
MPIKIVVAALTRNRPTMLSRLLRSLGEMDLPTEATVTGLIVENDTTPRSQKVVENHAELPNGLDMHYLQEPRTGIPIARNRAVDWARDQGADALVFVDDDQTVARNWLTELTQVYRETGALLLGGPQLLAPCPEGAGFWTRLMHRNMTHRFDKRARRAAAHADIHDTRNVTISTNNWFGDMRLFTEHRMRFDESLRKTGGSDLKLYQEVYQANLATGWVADAEVYEWVEPDRISFRYQFRRAMDTSNTAYRIRLEQKREPRWKVYPALLLKSLQALLHLVTLPFRPNVGLLDLARSTGWISGRIAVLLGRDSTHYRETTGS